MTTAQQIVAYIQEAIAKVTMDETEREMILDDAVYNTEETDRVSEINNQGLEYQATYLLESGWTEAEIKSAADEFIKNR